MTSEERVEGRAEEASARLRSQQPLKIEVREAVTEEAADELKRQLF